MCIKRILTSRRLLKCLQLCLPYFVKLGYTPLPPQLGWNAAMVPNQFSTYPTTPSLGVQQGDPLGPLGLALALQPIVHRIEREVPGLLVNAWYLDDGTLCGSLEDLAAALSIIESEGPPRGLLLNRSKSLIAAPANSSVDHPLLSDIPVTSDGFTLLGSPVGPADFCLESALWRIQKVKGSQ